MGVKMSSNDPNANASDSSPQIDEHSRQLEDEQRQMAEFGVAFDGRNYRYKEYRYDLLSDALKYAQLDRSRPTYRAEVDIQAPPLKAEKPVEAELRLMDEFGITFDGKYYRYDEYRYDHFADAIKYAQLQH
jgi:hypothetical protein